MQVLAKGMELLVLCSFVSIAFSQILSKAFDKSEFELLGKSD